MTKFMEPMWALMYLHDWDPVNKDGTQPIYPEIHRVYDTQQEAFAAQRSKVSSEKYSVRRAHRGEFKDGEDGWKASTAPDASEVVEQGDAELFAADLEEMARRTIRLGDASEMMKIATALRQKDAEIERLRESLHEQAYLRSEDRSEAKGWIVRATTAETALAAAEGALREIATDSGDYSATYELNRVRTVARKALSPKEAI